MEERYRKIRCFGEALTSAGRKGSSFRARRVSVKLTPPGSEFDVSPQLYDACVDPEINGGSDLASGTVRQYAAAVANIRVRVAPVNVIEHIKHVGPDLERYRLVNGKIFCDAKVNVRESRPNQGIAPGVAKGARCWVRESGWVEPHGMGT